MSDFVSGLFVASILLIVGRLTLSRLNQCYLDIVLSAQNNARPFTLDEAYRFLWYLLAVVISVFVILSSLLLTGLNPGFVDFTHSGPLTCEHTSLCNPDHTIDMPFKLLGIFLFTLLPIALLLEALFQIKAAYALSPFKSQAETE